MRIVLDAMGTDTCPAPDVEGGVLAARETGMTVILVGDEAAIRRELDRHQTAGLKLEVVHSPQAVTMTDKPAVVGKSKPESSMHIGMGLVRDGQADGFVTMGNTGAAHAIAMLFILKRITGVKRPALTGIFPILNRPVIFLDVGANSDCRPEWMVQFAIMGSIYAEKVLGIAQPRVTLVANGEEEGKGSQLVRDTAVLLQDKALPLNFVGNMEPKELFQARADVVVSDGFTGNVLLKTFEASTRYLSALIREELTRSPLSAAGGLLIRPAMRRVRSRIDTFEVGGAPLLGVKGVTIIGHGSSNAFAVKNAIIQASKAVQGNVVQAIETQLALLPAFSLTGEAGDPAPAMRGAAASAVSGMVPGAEPEFDEK